LTRVVGLRTEILLTLTLLLGAALLLGGMMMLQLMEKSLLQQRVVHLDSLTRIMAQSLSRGDGWRPNIDFQRGLPPQVNAVAWFIYDRDLNLIGSSGNEREGRFLVSRRQIAKLSGEIQQQIDFPALLNFFSASRATADFVVPIKAEKRFNGLLEIEFSLDDIRLNLLKLYRIMLIYVLLYGTVLILAGYSLLQRNIIKPARNLLLATEAVSLGNLDTRLPVAGPTEISRLAIAYNQMVEALRGSRAETENQIISLRSANYELKQTRDELVRSEKMASVGQLAAGLAHEVGNPLTALIGYLELLRQKTGTAAHDIIERSLVEANRIDFLVRELLNFSRSEQSDMVDIVDMSTELNAVVQLMRHQGIFTLIEVENKLPEKVIVTQISRDRLQQVYVNLLLNAIQACGKKGQIELTAGISGDQVWVGISDDGCGIDATAIGHIFDPFFTTKAPGEGTGLGLAISQRIIAEAGGTIEVESAVGEGSLFKILLTEAEDIRST